MNALRVSLRRIFAIGVALALLAGCGEQGEPAASASLPAALVQLIESIGVGEFDAAREQLAKLDRDALLPEQQALVYRIESQLHSVAEEYAPALQALERALDSGSLSPDEQLAARFDQGWLHAQLGQPARAIEAYNSWQARLTTPPSATQLLTVAEAHAAAGDCAGAAALIARASARITPEERVDLEATLEVAGPFCPDEPGLAGYGTQAVGS